jgi:hypothetical protein
MAGSNSPISSRGSGGKMKDIEIQEEDSSLLSPDSMAQLTPRTRAAYSARRNNSTTEVRGCPPHVPPTLLR